MLDQLAVLHDGDAVGDLGDHAEIVRDEQHGGAVRWPAARVISFRICACVVTSSAVVGSSAMRIVGSRISAIAIIARWRWPPESWCG